MTLSAPARSSRNRKGRTDQTLGVQLSVEEDDNPDNVNDCPINIGHFTSVSFLANSLILMVAR
jgi:hypothetical protein